MCLSIFTVININTLKLYSMARRKSSYFIMFFFYAHGGAHFRSTYVLVSIKHVTSTIFSRIKESFAGRWGAILENARKSTEMVRRTGDRGGCSPRIFRGPRDVHFRFLAQRQIFVAARDSMRLIRTRTLGGRKGEGGGVIGVYSDLKNIPREVRERCALFDKSPLTRGRNNSARGKGWERGEATRVRSR